MRDAWLRLDVSQGHREELAKLSGIPATNLSSFNTGRRPLTLEMAERIVAAVPGLTLEDLGAPAKEASESPSFPVRLGNLEAAFLRLEPLLERVGSLQQQLDDLTQRVAVLEHPESPGKTGDGRK